jgi:predicted MFS family arabinose efflux permease
LTVTLPSDQTSPAIDDRRELRRGRVAISALFGIAGAVIGTWTARMPAIQQHLDMADSHLGGALLALAVGGLIGMRLAGRLIDRHGSAVVATPTALAVGAALAATAYAPSLPTLAATLLLLGLLHGTLNVAMNAAAVACQTAYQRPIMSGFHAWFSIGGAAGAAAAAACAHARLSCPATFTLVAVTLTVIAVPAVRHLPRNAAPAPRVAPRAPGAAVAAPQHRRRILLLGALAFSCLLSEGAAADWGSVYLDRIGAAPATAAAAYMAFAAAMTMGRLVGDRITARLTPVTLLRGSGALACVGMAAGVLANNPAAAVAGFGLLGLGLSGIIPQLYSAAGTLDPEHPGAGLSRVAALGYAGFVAGPIVVGAAAMHVGLGNALLILPALAALIAAAASVVRQPPTPHRTQTADAQ